MGQFSDIDQFILYADKMSLKVSDRVDTFIIMAPGILLLPKSIVTW